MTDTVSMADHEQQGFDVVGTRSRLEEWLMENVATPISLNAQRWPGGRSESVRAMLFDLWGQLIVASRTVPRGFRKARSFDMAHGGLGVALAILEIDAYQTTVLEEQESPALDGEPLSRAVARYGQGRPRNLLADACAQQLRVAGFSYGDMATFMDVTEGAAKWHCKASDARSLLMRVEAKVADLLAAPHR